MNKSKGRQRSTSTSTSAPLSPEEVSGYFTTLNDFTRGGGSSRGRLFDFAKVGSPDATYNAPTNAQIQGLGGLGATRKRDLTRARDEELEQIAADPSLTTFQTQRSRQLTNRDAASGIDAVNDETEAAITEAAFMRAAKQLEASTTNADKLREDMAVLAEIFFGGKGQRSTSTSESTGKNSSFGFESPVSFGFKF